MSVTSDRSLIFFLLRRPERGVQVIEGWQDLESRTGRELFLGEVSPWKGRLYDPREEAPHLLQEFTALPPDPEAYARFATQWGLLGLASAFPVSNPGEAEPEPVDPEAGVYGTSPIEAVSDWERVVLEVRTVGELHGALINKDRPELERLLHLDDEFLTFGGALREQTARLMTEDAGPPGLTHPDWWELEQNSATASLVEVAGAECPDGDIEAAAWDLLAWSINSRTRGLIGYGLRAPDPKDPSHLQLQLSPRGQLYAWLWLQLAEQVAHRKPMQRCASCDQWYFQHPEARRQHGVYCSTRCRVAAWRKRKRTQQA